jgi:endonuclease/exonuclease/phosphatase family metal-dependent hydrolase
MKKLKVLSWNIRNGKKDSGEVNIEEFIATILEINPDIVFIQEMDRWKKRSGHVDQYNAIKKALGPEWDGIWGTRRHFRDKSLYGIASYSRYPIYESFNHILADAHLESTVAQEMIVKIGKDLVSCVNIHMPFDGWHGKYMVETSWNVLSEMKFSDNLIIGGDLNVQPDSQEIDMLLSECTDIGTQKTHEEGRIDYCMSRGVKPIEQEVLDIRLSDHFPLITTFC